MLRAIIGAALVLALSLPASAGAPVTMVDVNNVPIGVSSGAMNVTSTGTTSSNIAQIAGQALITTAGLPFQYYGKPNTPGQPCWGVSTLTGTQIPSANQSLALVGSSTQQIVGLAASTVIHVCSFDISASLTAGATFSLEYGTGTLCAVGTTVFANYAVGIVAAVDVGRGTGGQDLFSIPSGNAFCIVSGAFIGSAFFNSGTSQY